MKTMKKPGSPAAGWKRTPAALLLLVLLAGGCASVSGLSAPVAPGLTYELHVLEEPRINRVHVLRVDLAGGELVAAVALSENPPGDEFNATLTDPMALAAHPDTVAFVNTNPWSPWPPPAGDMRAKITGLAASGGEVRSPPTNSSVWFEGGRVFIGDPGDREITEGAGTWGNQKFVSEGEVMIGPGGGTAPRTSIGRNRDGTVMWLVVVDGRREGYSEGMTVYEHAVFMRELGCWEAVRMDGGGSSILAVNLGGGLAVVNRPSDGWRRPLPLVLTIRRRSE